MNNVALFSAFCPTDGVGFEAQSIHFLFVSDYWSLHFIEGQVKIAWLATRLWKGGLFSFMRLRPANRVLWSTRKSASWLIGGSLEFYGFVLVLHSWQSIFRTGLGAGLYHFASFTENWVGK